MFLPFAAVVWGRVKLYCYYCELVNGVRGTARRPSTPCLQGRAHPPAETGCFCISFWPPTSFLPQLDYCFSKGIDVARHLPHDALGNLMDLSMSSGVQLSTVYVSQVKPFSATLMAKVPQRDGEVGTHPPAAAAAAHKEDTGPASSPSHVATATAAAAASPEDAWIDGGAAAAAAAAEAATLADKAAEEAVAAGRAPETPVSPSVPGTTMGSGFGRPRLGVSKIAETTNSFEALGLALRYPSTRIFVRADLLAAGGGEDLAMGKKRSALSSFDAADLAELYPSLYYVKDAKERRSASEKMDSQFEMQKIRQQLESAVSQPHFFTCSLSLSLWLVMMLFESVPSICPVVVGTTKDFGCAKHPPTLRLLGGVILL